MADSIQKLKTDIALNQAIIIVGAGVSIYTTKGEQETAHWKGLLKNGLYRCHQSRSSSDTDFEHSMNKFDTNTATTDDYLSAANRVKDYLKKKSNTTREDVYKSWLFETVGKLVPKQPELIRAIGELECPILTTNYDSLLADVLGREPLTWNRYCTETDHSSLVNGNNYILHLHGYFEEPDTIVFSSGDYKRIRQNSSGLSKLKDILKAKSILLIGFDSGTTDPHLTNLLAWIAQTTDRKIHSIYRLTGLITSKPLHATFDISFVENIRDIQYRTGSEDLLSLIQSLKSFTPIIRSSSLLVNRRDIIRKKYFTYLIQENGCVSLLGYSNHNLNLPLESVYVELKFDPTHPSIRAMQTLEINEEFKRKILSYGFFDESERNKIIRAILERSAFGSETIYRDFMVEQWLTIFLSNRNIFTYRDASRIKNKIQRLKRSIMERNNFQETKQYRIQQAYQEFKHFIILGHPGSGKTTLSKWLVMNMAKECLGEENMLFNHDSSIQKKIPILIPIWKYVDQMKQNHKQCKKSLLQFICENSSFNSSFFDNEERRELSSFIMESLIQGNILVIFEGLDEVPAHVDRSDLIKDINTLLERGIDYDMKSNQLTYSSYEQKEINNIKDPNMGNRFIITSRIEGNYFEDINFYIPRLTIENMSNEALKLFCRSYTQCIQQMSNPPERLAKQDELDQLYNDIIQNKEIFQLAINPQLASVIAGLYNQCEGHLPEKRIDLYERAIQIMVNRLVDQTSNLDRELALNPTMLWSILQEIAEYLHSKVEGLSEEILKQIIRKYLIEQPQLPSSIVGLVSTFKYQAGLLNEFGQNSFRFIHRTFQEYLAAKSMIYSNGRERSEEVIYGNIISKIGIPNWRVPLSMAFGLLSKLSDQNNLFQNTLTRLLTNGQPAINTQFSTVFVPLVITDSLNDMYFVSKSSEFQLIQHLADWLLIDYQNRSGFARLKEHQELIHSYFSKLKQKYDQIMAEWLLEKLTRPKNIAACAHIAYQLKWYKLEFYEIFLTNIHNDSEIWNWPVDSILQFYAKEVKDEAVVAKLECKNVLGGIPKTVEFMRKNHDWLRLVIALCGGYRYYNIPSAISEYYEMGQFLRLSDRERAPFLFYYQEIWGRDDPAYKMAVHLDTAMYRNYWKTMPVFDTNDIYKESFLTNRILELLCQEKEAKELIEWLRMQINNETLPINSQVECMIALTTLGDFDFVNTIVVNSEKILIKCFANRVEQLICFLKDPIARCSSQISKYLLAIYNHMKMNPSKYDISFIDYCRIYLALSANSGGFSVNTTTVAEVVEDKEDQCYLYSEYWASKFTGARDGLDDSPLFQADECQGSKKGNRIIRSFLKINEATQMNKPVRGYAWPLDTFIFHSLNDDDIPIALFNCLETINTNLASIIQTIYDILIEEEYFTKNPQLIPLVVLFSLGIMSKDLDSSKICNVLLPELAEQGNMREFLLQTIQLISDPYYKSRALYQLAQLYDEKSRLLLEESFTTTREIAEPVLKFQVLEKIFNAVHYKSIEHELSSHEIIDQLISTLNNIEVLHEQVIASIRLSFYGSGDFRYKYLAHALHILMTMDQDDQQVKLIIKLKPLISLYDDLQNTLNQFVHSLKNKTHRSMALCHYGELLSKYKFILHDSHGTVDESEDYTEVQALFSLYAQLMDLKSTIGEVEIIDQLWINLFRNPHNQSNVTKILEIGLKTELFLTPQAAIVLDELVRGGNEECITVLFPYIIKPAHEVLPVVHRWFIDFVNKPIGRLAALLLVEARHLFEPAIDAMINLLEGDNDQMRYRAQRIFQHPQRDVNEPSKRISVLGERALIKILDNMHSKVYSLRVQTYLGTFFFDLLWDDPQIFHNLYLHFLQLVNTDLSNSRGIQFFNRIIFINSNTWIALMESVQLSLAYPLHVEALLQSVMRLTNHEQITQENWREFATVLSNVDTTQFRNRLYFSRTDVDTIQFIVDEIWPLTDVCDETYFEILESKLISTLTVTVEDLAAANYTQIDHYKKCNFDASRNLNEAILNILSNIPLDNIILNNLLKLLVHKMSTFNGYGDTWYSLILSDCLLSLMAACVQKDDYLYRKLTNSAHFDKLQLITLLEKMVHHHRFSLSRGSAFILLAALDQIDHHVIISAMNTLLDENYVKEYAMIGLPLIHLSPNELLDDLLSTLNSESAVKAYEILKIFTQFALDETIDTNGKSKIINYLANEIGQLKSKKPISYYYTDVKIPFTTTLENELYKAWIKIQGLSGKTQYAATTHT